MKQKRSKPRQTVEVKRPLTKGFNVTVASGGVIIFLITFLLYTPALQNDFVWDDKVYVAENKPIHSLETHALYDMLTSFVAGNWHPLTSLSLAIDYALWELNPLGYHLTNALLHGLNSLLVFLLVIRLVVKAEAGSVTPARAEVQHAGLSRMFTIAGITALLFGVHPLHVESVAWVAERKDLLCAFFFFVSMLLYLSYTASAVARRRQLWYSACLVFFIAALMSKPMAVTLPLILLLLDIYPLQRMTASSKTSKTVWWEKIPFVVISLISSVITITAQRAAGALRGLEHINLGDRLLNALRSLIFYLGKMILPVKLVPFYPFPGGIQLLGWPYLLSGLLAAFITVCCVRMAKRQNYIPLLCWLYYVITLLPVLGIIQVGDQAAADRYTYLPGVSMFLVGGIGFSWMLRRIVSAPFGSVYGGIAVTCILIFMFMLGRLTVEQIKVWRNAETLCHYIIKAFPGRVSFAHYYLGNIYNRENRLGEAVSEYKRALGINPDYVMAHYNLGDVYIKQGMLDEAIREYQKVIFIDPQYAEAHTNLGIVYERKGMFDKALASYKSAVTINANLPEARYNLGRAYLRNGLKSQAAEQFYAASLLFLKNDDEEWAQITYSALKQTNAEKLENALYEELKAKLQKRKLPK